MPEIDAENLGKLDKGLENLIDQSKKEMEKEIAINFQRALNEKKRDIKQITPEYLAESSERPDQIYAEPQEKRKKEKEDEKKDQQTQDQDLKDEINKEKKDDKEKNKNKEKKDDKEKKIKPEQKPAEKKEPDWQKEEPKTAEGGIARADIGDLHQQKSLQKTPAEKPPVPQEQQRRQGANLAQSRQQRKTLRDQKRKEKTAREAEDKQVSDQQIGKMSPLAFIVWLIIALITDILSLIPYVGVLFSWPFALCFGIYKWNIKIKREVAIATTALDFLAEGILSTLPANTLDVILTFILSRNTLVQKSINIAAKKIAGHILTPKK